MRYVAPLFAVLALGAGARADDIDDLAAKVEPTPRYAGYKADFRVEDARFEFHQADGSVQRKDWKVVYDGAKVVALVRSGDLVLIARCPLLAKTELGIPSGRYHLDTMLGPSLPTWQWLKPVKVHGSIYSEGEAVLEPVDRWEGGGETLTWVRERKAPPEAHVRHRFVFTVDPVFGYRVDGHYDAGLKEVPRDRKKPEKPGVFTSGTFCPGCYTVWPETAVYDRTVVTPAGSEGFHGYANNLLCMDRFDGNRDRTTWRKNGFIAYLDPRSGWSVVRTRGEAGGVPRMPICNAHNDFHVHIPLEPPEKPEADGLYHLRFHHRLMSLPPEMTKYIWDHMEMPKMGGPAAFIRFGRVEDFEDQPLPLTEPTRGLTWTSGGPDVATGEARSGTKSLHFKGSSWPNLPQVSLKPLARYRLEAYLKVEGEPGTKAFIRGDFYEWSPHAGKMLLLQETPPVEAGAGWQRTELEFATPAWDPFINLKFVLEGEGEFWLDDFSLAPLADASTAPDPGVEVRRPPKEEMRAMSVFGRPVWSRDPGPLPWHYDRRETCPTLEGEGAVETAGGTVRGRPGDLVVFPEGLECPGHIQKAGRKHDRFD